MKLAVTSGCQWSKEELSAYSTTPTFDPLFKECIKQKWGEGHLCVNVPHTLQGNRVSIWGRLVEVALSFSQALLWKELISWMTLLRRTEPTAKYIEAVVFVKYYLEVKGTRTLQMIPSKQMIRNVISAHATYIRVRTLTEWSPKWKAGQ